MDITKVKNTVEESLSLKINDNCAQKLVQLSRSTNKPIDDLMLEWEVFSMNENFKSITLPAMEKFCRKMTPRKSEKQVAKKKDEHILKLKSPGGGKPKTDTLMATYGVTIKSQNLNSDRPPLTPARKARNVPRFGGNKNSSKVVALKPATKQIKDPTGDKKVVASLYGNEAMGPNLSCSRWANIEVYKPVGGIYDTLEKSGKFRYMFSDHEYIRKSSSERVTKLGEIMKARLMDKESKQEMVIEEEKEQEDEGGFFSSVDIPGNGVVNLLGRILYERQADGSQQLMLEGDLSVSGGNRVKLDISVLDKYSIFPGQTVVVKGVNTSGHEVVAQAIYDDFSDPLESQHPSNVSKIKWMDPDSGAVASSPVMLLTAFGPFTATNTFDYDGSPLQSFAKVVAQKKPTVLILLGPLIDVNNPAIHTLDVTFQEAAVNLLNSFIKDCCQPGVAMQILIAPSILDAHHELVFPQPPYFDLDDIETPDPDLQILELMCNPSQFWVNDYFFAVTSYDVLHPLNRQLTYLDRTIARKSTKLELICEHLIKQRSFYPALTGPQLDRTFNKDLHLHRTPDVFLTSTNLKYFAINTPQGTAVLNSRTLARGSGCGAYSQILIQPPQVGKTKRDRLRADIIKI